jgi:hypothetical protein
VIITYPLNRIGEFFPGFRIGHGFHNMYRILYMFVDVKRNRKISIVFNVATSEGAWAGAMARALGVVVQASRLPPRPREASGRPVALPSLHLTEPVGRRLSFVSILSCRINKNMVFPQQVSIPTG